MSTQRACRACFTITTSDECPACHSHDLSKDWLGYLIVTNVEHSQIAEKMGIDKPGTYALKVR